MGVVCESVDQIKCQITNISGIMNLLHFKSNYLHDKN